MEINFTKTEIECLRDQILKDKDFLEDNSEFTTNLLSALDKLNASLTNLRAYKTFYCPNLDSTVAINDDNELVGWVYGYEVNSDIDFEKFGNTLYYCMPNREAEIDKLIADKGYNLTEYYHLEGSPLTLVAQYLTEMNEDGEENPLAMTYSVAEI